MNNILKEYADIALSDKQLKKLACGRVSIILYPNLHEYKTIDDVLGPYRAAIILFMAKPRYGHWCLLFQLDANTIEFFNPYGGFPDHSLEYIPMEFRKKSNQVHTILSKLMLNSPYELTYNEFAFQKQSKNIKTCGRWCIVRLCNKDLDLYQFRDYINNLSKYLKINGDELVTLLTLCINK